MYMYVTGEGWHDPPCGGFSCHPRAGLSCRGGVQVAAPRCRTARNLPQNTTYMYIFWVVNTYTTKPPNNITNPSPEYHIYSPLQRINVYTPRWFHACGGFVRHESPTWLHAGLSCRAGLSCCTKAPHEGHARHEHGIRNSTSRLGTPNLRHSRPSACCSISPTRGWLVGWLVG